MSIKNSPLRILVKAVVTLLQDTEGGTGFNYKIHARGEMLVTKYKELISCGTLRRTKMRLTWENKLSSDREWIMERISEIESICPEALRKR